MVSKVSHVTLGTTVWGIISFDFRGQNMGMYIKSLSSGHVRGLKCIVTIVHQLTDKKMHLCLLILTSASADVRRCSLATSW